MSYFSHNNFSTFFLFISNQIKKMTTYDLNSAKTNSIALLFAVVSEF